MKSLKNLSKESKIALVKKWKNNDFYYFTQTSFKEGIERSGVTGIKDDGSARDFIDGEFIKEVCEFMQGNPWTLRLSARDHFKSTSFYAHFAWLIYRYRSSNLDNYYFSYKSSLASSHIAKIKKIIANIPDFENLRDLKPTAEGVCSYSWDGEHKITLEPAGMLEFKRGLHPQGVMYGDDLLRDPTNKLDPLVIKKINETFKKEMIPMPHGEFHVVGTAQTNQDFFFDETIRLNEGEKWTRDNKKFAFTKQPAIESEKEKKVIFPEFRSWEWLQNQRDLLGDKLFDQEFMCSPAYDSDSYFTREDIMAVVNPKLKNINISSERETERDIIAGYDIGQKTHPAHVSIFEVISEDNRLYKQIHQKFFDKWDYIKQIEYLTEAVKNFKIDIVYYDATRGELDALEEQGTLPQAFEPVIFSRKSKNAMATMLYRKVKNKEIELIDNQRMINQILAVNNDLQAIETEEGHGDSFWSIALAVYDETKVQTNVIDLGGL